jgi:phosphate transport system protein
MGATVERAVVSAVWALMRHDASAARRVVGGDKAINELRYNLEEEALLLIARRQPFAGDLRIISAVIGVTGELERIGDYAHGIGQIVLRGADLPHLDPTPVLQTMAQRVREMLQQALQAVVQHGADVARFEQADDEVDQLYQQAIETLMGAMRERPDQLETAMYQIWAAHNLERIADRAVNIAERAAFIAGDYPPQPNHAD